MEHSGKKINNKNTLYNIEYYNITKYNKIQIYI